MKQSFRPDPLALRRAAYPPLAELADAIVKQESGDKSAMRDYVAKCLKVKEKFKKR